MTPAPAGCCCQVSPMPTPPDLHGAVKEGAGGSGGNRLGRWAALSPCTGSAGSEVLFFNINFNDSAEDLPPKLFSQFLTRHLRTLVDGLHMNFENFAASVL